MWLIMPIWCRFPAKKMFRKRIRREFNFMLVILFLMNGERTLQYEF